MTKPTLGTITRVADNNYVEELDKDITLEEVNDSIKNVGKGTSLDGICPDIMHILPLSMRKILSQLCNKVFSNDPYPTNWEEQLLIPHPKKGHKLSNSTDFSISTGLP